MPTYKVKVDFLKERIELVDQDGAARELDPSRWGDLLERLGKAEALENIRSAEGASAFGRLFSRARERHGILSFLNWQMDPKKRVLEDDGSIFGAIEPKGPRRKP